MEYCISVITPSFNSGKFIEAAINSVLKQNYPHYEHIIIDGGSTDGTLSILKKYPHLKWVSEPDNGQVDAMNKGFARSKGQIIVYLNADDFFDDDVFSTVINTFKRDATAEIVVGYLKILYDNNSEIITGTHFQPDLCLMLRWWTNDPYPLNPVSYFYLRKVQERIHFDSNLKHSFDYKFLLDCVNNKFHFTLVDKSMGTFRFTKGCKTYETNEPQYFSYLYTFTKEYWKYCPLEKRIFLVYFHYFYVLHIDIILKYPRKIFKYLKKFLLNIETKKNRN
jgi:glycosyltransferase involved in cell wall biosynthesis